IAERVPVAFGWNAIVMVQLAPAATELPQVFVSLKSAGLVPASETEVMLSPVVPTFVKVTVCEALTFPTSVAGNLDVVADSFTSVPTPLNVTDCGLPAALSVTVIVPVLLPTTVGSKLTLMLQLAPAANGATQLLP